MAQREPGRNDPCRCGSGLKYKRCCLGKEVAFVNYKGESAVYLRNELNVFANRLTALLEEIISGRDALAKLTGFKLLQDIQYLRTDAHFFTAAFVPAERLYSLLPPVYNGQQAWADFKALCDKQLK